jgi:hypothetical protein
LTPCPRGSPEIVVSDGEMSAAASMSSNPITAMSSGTRKPFSRTASSAPIATTSFVHNTASGGSFRSSNERSPSAPKDRENSPRTTSNRLNPMPADDNARRYPLTRSAGGPSPDAPVMNPMRR